MTGGILATLSLLVVPASRAIAEPLAAFRDCTVCPEMVGLPLGAFTMGAPDDEFRRNFAFDGTAIVRATPDAPCAEADEGPQVRVTVNIPIAMGSNEATYDEWAACVADGGCGGKVLDGMVGQADWVETVLRSLADPRLAVVPDTPNIAREIAECGFMTVRGRYPVRYVFYFDALTYSAWLNAQIGTDAYRVPIEVGWEYASGARKSHILEGLAPCASSAS